MDLLQWRDATKRSPRPRPTPVVFQFGDMVLSPLNHESEHARRQLPRENNALTNRDRSLMLGVFRVEVWSCVVFVEHEDRDSEEPAEDRHGASPLRGRIAR